MSDRRPSLFSRFLGSTTPATPRRTPAVQTTGMPAAAQTPARPRAPATDTPVVPPPTESQTAANASTASRNRPNVQPETTSRRPPAITNNQSTDSSTINAPTANAPESKAPRSSDELQRVGESKNSAPARPTEDSNKVLPSAGKQSRSPPLPSSPSRVAPQPSTPLSPSRMSTQLPSTPPLRSPSRGASRSPKSTSSPSTIKPQAKSSPRESLTKSRSKKGTESPSSSKESRRSIDQDISKPTASAKSSNPSGHLEHRLEAEIAPNHSLDEKKEVKDVVQATYTEPDEHNAIKKAIEKEEILSTSHLNKEPINPPVPQAPNRTMIPDMDNNLVLNRDIKKDLSTFANRMAIADHSKADKTPSVITLAGENRGAVMQIGSNPSQREGPVHIHRGYKLNGETTADEDQESDRENKSKESKNEQDQPPETAYVNNNTQALNNSIVLSSSVSERDPGVHIAITKESVRPTTPGETRKVQFNTSASKVTYQQPTVRRRCLKGMLLESSDSDPEKPRRHGCRAASKEIEL